MKKIKRFVFDIEYDIGKGDKRSSRYRTVKRILEEKEKNYGKGLTKDKLGNHSSICAGLGTKDFIPSPIEKLELLILEKKAGHDALCDEMLNWSKQMLSMNIINQEQLENFLFNYGK